MPVPMRAAALVLLGMRHLSSVETRPYAYLQF